MEKQGRAVGRIFSFYLKIEIKLKGLMSQFMYLKPGKNICNKNVTEMHLWGKISKKKNLKKKKISRSALF